MAPPFSFGGASWAKVFAPKQFDADRLGQLRADRQVFEGLMVQLERETLNSLFDTLLIWEKHLTQHDLIDLGCDDEHFG